MAVQSQLYNLGVGGVPQSRVKNLGNDLMGLFGAVGKGVQTYENIGETAAKIEFQEQQRIATDKITAINVAMENAKQRNDTESMASLMQDVDNVTRDILLANENLKDSDVAYNAYTKLALDYSSSVKSTLMPSMTSSYLSSDDKNQENALLNQSSKLASLNMPFDLSTMETYADNRASIHGDEKGMLSFDYAAKHNIDNATGQLAIDPTEIARKLKLYKYSEDGKSVIGYDIEGDTEKIIGAYFPHVKLDGDNIVASSKYTTQEQIKEVETFIGTLRGKLIDKESGEVHNFRFRALKGSVEETLSGIKNGTITPFDFTTSSQFKEMTEIYESGKLSDSERNMYGQLIADGKVLTEKVTTASSLAYNAIKTDDTATIRSMLNNGYGEISASVIQAQVSNNIQELDNSAFNYAKNGDYVNASIVALKAKSLNGQTGLSTGGGYYDHKMSILNGNTQPTSIADIYSSVELLSQAGKIAKKTEFTKTTKLPIENIFAVNMQTKLNKANSEAKELFPDNPTKQFAYVNAEFIKARKEGLDSFTGMYNQAYNVMSFNRNTIASKSDGWFNLGTAKPDVDDMINWYAYNAAQQGKFVDNNTDKALEFVEANSIRFGTGIFGNAMQVPKLVSSSGKELNETNYKNLLAQSMVDLKIDPRVAQSLDGVNIDMRFNEKTLQPQIRFNFTRGGTILSSSIYYGVDDIVSLKDVRMSTISIAKNKQKAKTQQGTNTGSTAVRRK